MPILAATSESPEYAESIKSFDSAKSNGAKSTGFKAGSSRRRGSRSRGSSLSHHSVDTDDRPHARRDADWGIGDDAKMSLE